MRKRAKKREVGKRKQEEREGGEKGERGKEKKFQKQIYIYSFSHMKVETEIILSSIVAYSNLVQNFYKATSYNSGSFCFSLHQSQNSHEVVSGLIRIASMAERP